MNNKILMGVTLLTLDVGGTAQAISDAPGAPARAA
jgi:hypothetical protein